MSTYSITSALAEARRRISIYGRGRDWYVSTYSPAARGTYVDRLPDVWHARRVYTESVVELALSLLGYGPDEIPSVIEMTGTARERVKAAIVAIEGFRLRAQAAQAREEVQS